MAEEPLDLFDEVPEKDTGCYKVDNIPPTVLTGYGGVLTILQDPLTVGSVDIRPYPGVPMIAADAEDYVRWMTDGVIEPCTSDDGYTDWCVKSTPIGLKLKGGTPPLPPPPSVGWGYTESGWEFKGHLKNVSHSWQRYGSQVPNAWGAWFTYAKTLTGPNNTLSYYDDRIQFWFSHTKTVRADGNGNTYLDSQGFGRYDWVLTWAYQHIYWSGNSRITEYVENVDGDIDFGTTKFKLWWDSSNPYAPVPTNFRVEVDPGPTEIDITDLFTVANGPDLNGTLYGWKHVTYGPGGSRVEN